MLCCARDEMDEEYRKEPGVVRSKTCFSRDIRIYNQSKYFVELEIRDVRGSFLKKITLGAFQGQAGAEFDQGDTNNVQVVRVVPGMMKKIRVGTSKYTITAYMNGRELFNNRMYTTRQYPVFQDRHYREVATNARVRHVPHEFDPDPCPCQDPPRPRRRWWWFF